MGVLQRSTDRARESDMYRKLMSTLQILNLLFQALYSLAFPIGVGALLSYLLTKFASAPGWIWAVFILIGTFMGLYSMVKFLISALSGLERLEKERERSDAEKREKEEKRKRLNESLASTTSEEENNE